MADKKIMKAETVSSKKFSYTLDGVDVNLTLRTDVKKELKACKEILVRAIQDIDDELKAMSPDKV